LKFFAIPQWWLPLREAPQLSPKDSHCDSAGVTETPEADSMGFYGEPCGIEEVPENLRRFNGWGFIPYSIFHHRVDGDSSDSMSSILSQRR
jgi:hypothetical protein